MEKRWNVFSDCVQLVQRDIAGREPFRMIVRHRDLASGCDENRVPPEWKGSYFADPVGSKQVALVLHGSGHAERSPDVDARSGPGRGHEQDVASFKGLDPVKFREAKVIADGHAKGESVQFKADKRVSRGKDPGFVHLPGAEQVCFPVLPENLPLGAECHQGIGQSFRAGEADPADQCQTESAGQVPQSVTDVGPG